MRVDTFRALLLFALLLPPDVLSITSRAVKNAAGMTGDVPIMPAHDGTHLRLYTLPIGQGSAHVIQCPNGDVTIFDHGTRSKVYHWDEATISHFLDGHWGKIKNVVISHQHEDHTNLLEKTLENKPGVNLKNIYISCNIEDINKYMKCWLKRVTNGTDKLREFNGGNLCGSSTPCTSNPKIDLCPRGTNPGFNSEVIWANQGCGGSNKNTNSLVLKITYIDANNNEGVSILLPGDYEPPADLIAAQPAKLKSTAYVFSHHGSRSGDLGGFTSRVQPEVAFASGDPFYHTEHWGHPHCEVIAEALNTVCRFGTSDCDSGGRHQPTYTCTDQGKIEQKSNNAEQAIFTTISSRGSDGADSERNLLLFETDGVTWSADYATVGRVETGTRVKRETCNELDECCEREVDGSSTANTSTSTLRLVIIFGSVVLFVLA